MGGEKRVAAQKERGKLTARERMHLLFDDGHFTELDAFVKHRATFFGMADKDIPAEGVVTGFGRVNGRTVYAFAQDFTSQGGSLGEMHAKKITKVQDLALKTGCPIVGFNDSGGARIQEGVDALSGYGEIFFRNSAASGTIPQISAIMGPCAGGAVYSPAMTDFIFMTRRTSNMFITGPKVIQSVTGEAIDPESLGGADVHASTSGVCHFACDSDEESIEKVRLLLSYLPQNNMEDPPYAESEEGLDKDLSALDSFIPDEPRAGYDMRDIIAQVCDADSWLEVHEQFAANILTGFARLGGRVIGIIANQPMVLAGCLDVDASDKSTRFIRFCDAFNIPLLTIVDVPGFLPGVNQEHMGIIRHGAKMLWCYSEATVPKLTLVVRKDYGGSYLAMCSKHQGADFVAAWPTAEIAVMGAEGAVEVLYAKEIKAAEDAAGKRKEKLDEYREAFYSPYVAAARGYIDTVIMPSTTRQVLYEALAALADKREVRPPKKHGNIPM
ncbi:MAG: methylmalonyl-CoA carboxyltransferase [Deltaproteobacteria bacterium]|nr:methylmalonyl-CoA carboxyltransferase [Deltaproteobacteria bacterium]